MRFTPERRERFLTLLEVGRTVRDACADVHVSQTTIGKWAARGRATGATVEEVEFAVRFDAIREGTGSGQHRPLTSEDLVALLERAARRGSVQAMKLLLERPWERKNPDGRGEADPTDPFAALDELAPRRQTRATT
jgi:hypothetical protein